MMERVSFQITMAIVCIVVIAQPVQDLLYVLLSGFTVCTALAERIGK